MMTWLVMLGNVTLINLVLSGDNALAISMTASKLPKPVRKKAVIWGTLIAIISLIVFVALGTYFIQLPAVRLTGSLLLMFIAVKLTADQFRHTAEEAGSAEVQTERLHRAIGMILIADLSMSLDNAVAMVGVADGRMSVLLTSLLISIPILVVASNLIATVIEKLPWILYAASAYITWIAGQMFAEDPLMKHLPFADTLTWAAPVTGIVIYVLALLGIALWSRRSTREHESGQTGSSDVMTG